MYVWFKLCIYSTQPAAVATPACTQGEGRSHLELDPNLSSSLCLLWPLRMMMEIREERGDRRCHEKFKIRWETLS